MWEDRYSPTWIDGKKHARNVYAHTCGGVRGETQGADYRDEDGAGRAEVAESGRNTPAAGAGEGEEGAEANEEG